MKTFIVKATETLKVEKHYRVQAEGVEQAADLASAGRVAGVLDGRSLGIVDRQVDRAGVVEMASQPGGPVDGPVDGQASGTENLEIVDKDAARRACRILVDAYASNPEYVDWSDVQASLAEALKAFGLPEDYPEKVWQARLAREEAGSDPEGDGTIESSVMGDLGLG